jgi:bacteriocin biosynthesis cyclodehydratase domain-containing protein
VLIAGYRGLGLPIAGALAGAGVGHVALDVGSGPGDDAGILVIRMAAPDADTRHLRAADATFVVYADPRLALTGPARRGQPHLAVEIRDTAVVIGPLVPAAGTPCVRCLDLHRSDRDPAWPTLAVQLATLHADPVCPATTLLAAAAYAAHEVLTYLDGRPATTEGATIEVSGPGRARRRSWPAHPACTCRLRPARGEARAARETP